MEKLNPSFEYKIITVFQKDSLEIIKDDLEKLKKLIELQQDNKFIITHGTDTMMETAAYLNDHVNNNLIIITGAMLPERFSNSDAPINLGCAIGALNLLNKGVFIAMHGIVKPYMEIKRNMKTGKYY